MFFHDDNNLLDYDNRSLFERFPRKIKGKIGTLKSILRGNNKIIEIIFLLTLYQ